MTSEHLQASQEVLPEELVLFIMGWVNRSTAVMDVLVGIWILYVAFARADVRALQSFPSKQRLVAVHRVHESRQLPTHTRKRGACVVKVLLDDEYRVLSLCWAYLNTDSESESWSRASSVHVFSAIDLVCTVSVLQTRLHSPSSPLNHPHLIVTARMGYRHQAFVVARVGLHGTPVEYQCVASFWHQWCSDGMIPVRAVRWFVSMITRRETADIVRGELRQLEVQGWEPVDPDRPCPFILSLLCHAYTSSPDSPRKILSDVQNLYENGHGVHESPWAHGKIA